MLLLLLLLLTVLSSRRHKVRLASATELPRNADSRQWKLLSDAKSFHRSLHSPTTVELAWRHLF